MEPARASSKGAAVAPELAGGARREVPPPGRQPGAGGPRVHARPRRLLGCRRWVFNEAPWRHPDAARQRSPLTRAAEVGLLALFVLHRAGHGLVVDFSRVPISSRIVLSDESAIVAYKAGCAVRLRGTGEWSPHEHFHARVVDIRDGGETVEVRYTRDRGRKCFRKREFESLLTPMLAPGRYEVGMVVPLQREGRLFKFSEWATIVEIRSSDDTVRVHYRNGGYQRLERSEFECVLLRTPPWDQIHKEIKYHKLSTTIATSVVGMSVCHLLALFPERGGVRADPWAWYSAPFASDFRIIGVLLAMCTYIESISMASLQATACRVLDNFRLVLTALMMWMMVGRHAKPTATMWLALLSTTLGMVTLTVGEAKHEDVERRPVDVLTILVVLSKIAISSGLASFGHLSFKRNHGMPLYAHLSPLFLTWGVVTLVLSLVVEPRMMSSAEEFFQGWNRFTLLAVLSHLAKVCLTMTVLKYLDSIWKSMGDFGGALVLHNLHVALPMFSKVFDAESFLAMWVVAVSLAGYVLLKDDHMRIVALHESIERLRGPGGTCSPSRSGSELNLSRQVSGDLDAILESPGLSRQASVERSMSAPGALPSVSEQPSSSAVFVSEQLAAQDFESLDGGGWYTSSFA